MEYGSLFAMFLVSLFQLCQGVPGKTRPTQTSFKIPTLTNSTAGRSIPQNTKKNMKKSCDKTPLNTPSVSWDIKIYSERRYLVQMTKKGHLKGVPFSPSSDSSPLVLFEMEPVGKGLFRIKGKLSSLYLSMDKKGRFYSRKNANNESVFKEISTNHGFSALESYEYCSHYIGMKRNGHLKRTNRPNHSAHFLIINLTKR